MADTVERYGGFDIERVSMPLIGTGGIELHYDDGSHKRRVGFIVGCGTMKEKGLTGCLH